MPKSELESPLISGGKPDADDRAGGEENGKVGTVWFSGFELWETLEVIAKSVYHSDKACLTHAFRTKASIVKGGPKARQNISRTTQNSEPDATTCVDGEV